MCKYFIIQRNERTFILIFKSKSETTGNILAFKYVLNNIFGIFDSKNGPGMLININ